MRWKATTLGLLLLLLLPVVAAMCPVSFTPPNSFVHLTDDTQGLIVYDEDTQRQEFVVRQAYEGVASDFGLVLPTPGEPNFTERDEALFRQLHDMTKEPEDRNRLGGGLMESHAADVGQEVEVIKTRDVGDFSATVLRADTADALVRWLQDNGYNYGNESEANFKYYIDQGGYYFTALKINVEEANCLTRNEYEQPQDMPDRLRDRSQDRPEDDNHTGRCYLKGGLKPVEFEFTTDQPMLPLRIMSRPHDDSPISGSESNTNDGHDHNHEIQKPGNFLLYTLSDQPLVIPGAKVKYADRIDSTGGEIAEYNPGGQFLVRQRFKFNAHKVQEDLFLDEAAPFFVPREDSTVINPDQTDTPNGMIAFEGSSTRVSLTENPSFSSETAYRMSKITHSAGQTLNTIKASLSIFFIAFLVIGAGILKYPSLLLLLMFPIAFGLLWSRRKALKAVFFGTYIGTFIASLSYVLMDNLFMAHGGVVDVTDLMILTVYMAIVSIFPALLAGVIAFLASHIGHRHGTVETVQRQHESESARASIGIVAGSVIVSTILAGIGYLPLEESVGRPDTILPLSLPFAAIPVFVLYGKYRQGGEEQDLQLERDDWKWVAVAAGILLLIGIGISIILSGQSLAGITLR